MVDYFERQVSFFQAFLIDLIAVLGHDAVAGHDRWSEDGLAGVCLHAAIRAAANSLACDVACTSAACASLFIENDVEHPAIFRNELEHTFGARAHLLTDLGDLLVYHGVGCYLHQATHEREVYTGGLPTTARDA